jgi:hypothetical protein
MPPSIRRAPGRNQLTEQSDERAKRDVLPVPIHVDPFYLECLPLIPLHEHGPKVGVRLEVFIEGAR